MRGDRLQLDGLDLDDAWAGRLRTAGGRVAYFKQKQSLAAYRDGDGAAAVASAGAVSGAAFPPPGLTSQPDHRRRRTARRAASSLRRPFLRRPPRSGFTFLKVGRGYYGCYNRRSFVRGPSLHPGDT